MEGERNEREKVLRSHTRLLLLGEAPSLHSQVQHPGERSRPLQRVSTTQKPGEIQHHGELHTEPDSAPRTDASDQHPGEVQPRTASLLLLPATDQPPKVAST